MSVRLVNAPISISFSENTQENRDLFLREYDKASQTDEDPIAQWLKIAKARGETADSDAVVVNLLVELHRKIDNLEKYIKNEESKKLPLSWNEDIQSIGYGHFKLVQPVLVPDMEYYGRITMPVHPKRDIAVYFKALDTSLANITKMHARDEQEWSMYLTARERILIRESKESK
ncbi:MAG: hypothetical protein PHX13_11720 [Thiovulaceae bacterium]|nr:hypothetical protein [Sulfurimonadaceae bacterium]